MRYQKGGRSVREIGRDLGVDYVLEGSIRANGLRTRITAQLIRVQEESHLWADSYDRESGDFLGVEIEVARHVASEVRLVLDSRQAAHLDRPIDARAHDEYLLGRYQWNKRTEEGYRKAVAHFEQALAIDPSYAAAYAGLADAWLLLAGAAQAEDQMIPKARSAALKAVEIDPLLAEAHTSLGLLSMNYEWDWAASEREYRRALELNSNYATARHWYAEFLNAQGRFDEALSEMARARELDPLSLIMATDTGKVLFYARRYSQALEWLRKVLAEDQTFEEAHIYLSETLLAMGRFQEALADLDRFPEWAHKSWVLDRKAFAFGKLGRA
jgi:tetratricopeptide (TPR) repeat protein